MKTATTVTKVCRILDQLQSRPSLGITDLARSLQLLPSDVHRIVSSLQLYGYVEQNPETRRYHPGAGLLRLGLSTVGRNVLGEKGRAVLQRLSSRLNAATHLGLLDAARCEVFLADQVCHPALSLFQSKLGSTAAIHSTALGKAIMAGMSPETFERAVERSGLRKSTSQTITELPELEKELELVRQRGYAIDCEESTEGACCIGSPIRNVGGTVVGALSASMQTSRFRGTDRTRLALVVNSAAAELSGLLGYGVDGRTRKAATR